MTRLLVFLSVCVLSCAPEHTDPRIAAAAAVTRNAQSPIVKWDVRSHAAGGDCDVLLVETAVVMDAAMVEVLHYGAGAYELTPGGFHQFARDQQFRGVAYRDRSKRVWTYGEVGVAEAKSLRACR